MADQIIKEFKRYRLAEDSNSKNTTELYTCTNTIKVYSNKGNIIYILLY